MHSEILIIPTSDSLSIVSQYGAMLGNRTLADALYIHFYDCLLTWHLSAPRLTQYYYIYNYSKYLCCIHDGGGIGWHLS